MEQKRVLTFDTSLIMLATLFYMASTMIINPLITGYSEELGASGTMMGFVGGMSNILALFCRPFVGNWTDRFSKFKLSALGAIMMLVAGFGYVFAPNMAVVVLARLCNGLGFACCSVSMSTWMSSLLPKDKAASGMGLYGTINALSMAIAPVIGVRLRSSFGYKAAFLGAAVCALLMLVLIPLVKDKGEPVAVPAKESGGPLKIADKRVIPIAIMGMLYGIPYFATQSFLVRYCEVRNLPVNYSAYFVIYACVLLFLRLTVKDLFDRLPYQVFALTACAAEAIGLVCMTFLYHNWIMVAAAICFAASYGIMCSVCQSTAITIAGPGGRGLANSTYYMGMDLAMSLGPVLGGMLYGNLDIALFYPVLGLTVPVCAVLAAKYRINSASRSSAEYSR